MLSQITLHLSHFIEYPEKMLVVAGMSDYLPKELLSCQRSRDAIIKTNVIISLQNSVETLDDAIVA